MTCASSNGNGLSLNALSELGVSGNNRTGKRKGPRVEALASECVAATSPSPCAREVPPGVPEGAGKEEGPAADVDHEP